MCVCVCVCVCYEFNNVIHNMRLFSQSISCARSFVFIKHTLNNFKFTTRFEVNHRFVVRYFSLKSDAKHTQLQTSRMSNLRVTPLAQISEQSYRLFQNHVQSDEVKFLNDIFRENGFEIRLAGGGVRDLLCGIVPHDIDFATDARPDQMIHMLSEKPNIRLITTTSGKKHGTVTARIDNKVQFEITTLRIDKTTDGRHAEVEFVNDWKIDASRRDLTINSMFIDLRGTLYDYFDGENDLKQREIRFVGDTEKRLREDYLRIFRYFRFHTRFGVPGRHDETTLQIIKRNMDGLAVISGERIWSELKRILTSIECADSIDIMFNRLEVGRYMGFAPNAECINLDEFNRTCERLSQYAEQHLRVPPVWKPQTLFSALVRDIEQLCSIVTRLRLSNYERDTMAYIVTNRGTEIDPFDSHLLKSQLALAPKPNQAHMRDHIVQYLYYMGSTAELIREIAEWPIPAFPFNGHMVANRVKKKRQISLLLDELKSTWAANRFDMTEQQMQQEVDRVLQQFENENSITPSK